MSKEGSQITMNVNNNNDNNNKNKNKNIENKDSNNNDNDKAAQLFNHVFSVRPKWTVNKISSFIRNCRNTKDIIDFNIKCEDLYIKLWKTDKNVYVVQFLKSYIDLLKYIKQNRAKFAIALNFELYDFGLIQKCYTRFYNEQSIVKRIQSAMLIMEIFQLVGTIDSLDIKYIQQLKKIQDAIFRSWNLFWSDKSNITFFSIINDNNNNSELNDVNEQLTFVSEVLTFLRQQINRIKVVISNFNGKYLRDVDRDTYFAILACLRKLLKDLSSVTSTCLSKNTSKANNSDVKPGKTNYNTSSYLRTIIDMFKDLVNECCKTLRKECMFELKSVFGNVLSHNNTHPLIQKLLQSFIEKINYCQVTTYMINTNMDDSNNTDAKNDEKDEEVYISLEELNNNPTTMENYSNNYAYNIEIINSPYFCDKLDINPIQVIECYQIFMKDAINTVLKILKSKNIKVKYMLSCSPYDNIASKNGDNYDLTMDSQIRIIVTVNEANESEFSKVIQICTNEIMDTVKDGFQRLRMHMYPMNNSCKDMIKNDYFSHCGLSIKKDIESNKDELSRAVLCLTLQKKPTKKLIKERFKLLTKLKDVLHQVYTNRSYYEIFGSISTRLDHIDSDLDISIHLYKEHPLAYNNYFKDYIDPNEMNSSIDTSNTNIITIEKKGDRIRKILRPIHELITAKVSNEFKNFTINYYDHATVPIIKLKDNITNLQSDISVCIKQSKLKTLITKKFVLIDWRVKPLVLSIKHWVKTRNICNTHRGCLNSFGYTLMIFQYLQMVEPPILPKLDIDTKIFENNLIWAQPDKFVNFGNKNKMTLGQLFQGFFKFYYHKFNHKKHAISINDGKLREKNKCNLKPGQNYILIVLDPIDTNDNVARRVTEQTISRMKIEFQEACKALKPIFHI